MQHLPEMARRAVGRLGTMRQGRQSLTDYLAEFDRTLLEAKANDWTDTVKIDYLIAQQGLKTCLNTIKQTLLTKNIYPHSLHQSQLPSPPTTMPDSD